MEKVNIVKKNFGLKFKMMEFFSTDDDGSIILEFISGYHNSVDV